jgi:hypothetical protein
LDLLYCAHPGGWEACELLLVQSVLFHALDYSSRLGFEPHPDFMVELFGPRPSVLIDTPWRAVPKPIYIAGPRDDTGTIVSRLEASGGPDAFEIIAPILRPNDSEYDDEEALAVSHDHAP